MRSEKAPEGQYPRELLRLILACLVGAFLAIALLKWGNPVILDDPAVESVETLPGADQSPPSNLRYGCAAALLAGGLALARWRPTAPKWLLSLPLIWFGWQLLAGAATVDDRLSQATLKHFAACTAFFYLGLFALYRPGPMKAVVLCLTAGMIVVLCIGFRQHYGGLEANREFYEKLYQGKLPPEIQSMYDTPQFRRLFDQPGFQKRIASSRIFGTLVYPNALAGAILLILPAGLTVLWRLCRRLPFVARGVPVGLLFYAGIACLIWSGSKSGWLIALVAGLISVLRLSFPRRVKAAIMAVSLVVGLAGFCVKFADYFQHGATSVGARFDYWRAALKIAGRHPILGTGPGTFYIPYREIKGPEAESTRLVHNNFLEQACDSGIAGFLAFSTFVLASLVHLYRKGCSDSFGFSLWLGLLGWSLQGVVEFGLYIPALAWPAFFFFGGLLGTDFGSTTSGRPS